MDWLAIGLYLATFMLGGTCGILIMALVVGSHTPPDPREAVDGLEDGQRDRDERWDVEREIWRRGLQRTEGQLTVARDMLRLSKLARLHQRPVRLEGRHPGGAA